MTMLTFLLYLVFMDPNGMTVLHKKEPVFDDKASCEAAIPDEDKAVANFLEAKGGTRGVDYDFHIVCADEAEAPSGN